MAPKLPLHHPLDLPTAEAHLGPGGIRTCCQHVVVTALMAWVILTDKMGKQTWQSLTQPLYLLCTHHCLADNREPQTLVAAQLRPLGCHKADWTAFLLRAQARKLSKACLHCTFCLLLISFTICSPLKVKKYSYSCRGRLDWRTAWQLV